MIYDKRPYDHRTIVLREASGLANTDDSLAYFLREMLSAGKFDHLVTETGERVNAADRGAVRITKEGPTNFIVTTTLVSLEPELETRLVSVNVDESEEHTRRIIAARVDQAATVGTSAKMADPAEWHELQRWLATEAQRDVMLDGEVARLIKAMDTSTVRARRDVGKVMGLTMTNALLHQTHRDRHEDTGAIIADMRDYRVTYELAGTALGHTAQTTVADHIRRTVEAVRDTMTVGKFGPEAPTSAKVAERLGENGRTVRRWLSEAEDMGYIRNTNPGHGRVAQWEADGQLPTETRPFLAPPTPLPPPLAFTLTMRGGKHWAVFPWSAQPSPCQVSKCPSAGQRPINLVTRANLVEIAPRCSAASGRRCHGSGRVSAVAGIGQHHEGQPGAAGTGTSYTGGTARAPPASRFGAGHDPRQHCQQHPGDQSSTGRSLSATEAGCANLTRRDGLIWPRRPARGLVLRWCRSACRDGGASLPAE